ncbi:type VII secretion system-associated protein [Streptomyces sp. NPDC020983]|uniref:type VII secretion system-associated protein n=1 Tax=Streptomyces sp. NPDC020983 TaxID=3365106 RepID=UPI0037898343
MTDARPRAAAGERPVEMSTTEGAPPQANGPGGGPAGGGRRPGPAGRSGPPAYGDGDAAGDPELPAVPDHVREAARLAPGTWLPMVDPAWSEEGEEDPPDWARLGSWRSDEAGEVAEWRANPEYLPSPASLGWPEPADPVDAAVQRAVTGWGPSEDVPWALARTQVAVFRAPGGGLATAVAPDHLTPVVPVFTAPRHLEQAGRLSFETLELGELLDRLPEGHVVYLNPTGTVSMTVETAELRAALAEAAAEDAETAAVP